MTTEVTLTGTGIPTADAARAGAGVLLRSGRVLLQFDAGRGTVMRLCGAGVRCRDLDALLLTHVHSDHVVDLADVVMTRWLESSWSPAGPLTIVAPAGPTVDFARRALDPFADDLKIRSGHTGAVFEPPEIVEFEVPSAPEVVWREEPAGVEVSAVRVHHEPVPDAVAFRVDTPDGAVVVSGDTRVCDEVERLATGARILVHEAARSEALRPLVTGTPMEGILEYHADTTALGAMAQRAGVEHLVLTHLIPPPTTDSEEEGFVTDIRDGGYTGEVTVGRDLTTVTL